VRNGLGRRPGTESYARFGQATVGSPPRDEEPARGLFDGHSLSEQLKEPTLVGGEPIVARLAPPCWHVAIVTLCPRDEKVAQIEDETEAGGDVPSRLEELQLWRATR
jgi:hypothetical protein